MNFFVFLILAVVFLVKTGNDIKCVLKSQIIRILAYLLPFVKTNDIIVTAGMVYFNFCKTKQVAKLIHNISIQRASGSGQVLRPFFWSDKQVYPPQYLYPTSELHSYYVKIFYQFSIFRREIFPEFPHGPYRVENIEIGNRLFPNTKAA